MLPSFCSVKSLVYYNLGSFTVHLFKVFFMSSINFVCLGSHLTAALTQSLITVLATNQKSYLPSICDVFYYRYKSAKPLIYLN